MSDTAIKVDGLSKEYRLGVINHGVLFRDLQSMFARLRGKEDPNSLITLSKHLTPSTPKQLNDSTPRAASGQAPQQNEELKQHFLALNDVSFEVKQGDALGIIGRNGAGKSTLLKILSRITSPSSGSIKIKGRIASLLEVGTGFHPELTGRENVYLNGAILGMRRWEIARKMDEIIAFAELEKFIDTPVKRYSSGMYVRLAFAVAAHLDAEILVMDEVLAVGDLEFQKKCLGKMDDVAKKQGRTVLFVSHNMTAIQQLCNCTMLLEKGRANQIGDTAMVIKEYSSSKSGSNQAHKQWLNTNNTWQKDEFTPLELFIGDIQGNHVTSGIQRDADLYVYIKCEIKKIDISLTIGYSLYDERGNYVYYSYQTDTHEEQWPRLKLGINTIKSKLPLDILNPGSYRLNMMGGLHCKQWFFEPGKEVPFLEFCITGKLSDSPYFTNIRNSILSPIIKWTIA